MKEIAYTSRIGDQIISHENHMLGSYMKAIKEYIPLFEENGYSLNVGLMWTYCSINAVLFERGSFKNGYQCYVYCVVQKDGSEVRIDSIDGEAVYYPLSTAWMISSIFRKHCKLNVMFYEDLDDIAADLNGFLSQLRHTD